MTKPEFFARLLPDFAARLTVLPDKPDETPEGALKALWYTAAGHPRSAEAATCPLPDLGPAAAATLEALIAKRLGGVPLAHLTGRQHFMGLEFLAGPGALVPRKETEILARTALAKLKAAGPSPVAIDLCTGSGNIAVSLARLHPGAKVYASDLSEEAVALARENVCYHGLGTAVELYAGDLFGGLPTDRLIGKVDLVSCNPPYISSAKVETMAAEISRFEPRLAFDGGGFGLTIVSRLMKEAVEFLKPGGWLCFEIGKGQGKFLSGSLKKIGAYDAIEPVTDADGEIRVLTARRAG